MGIFEFSIPDFSPYTPTRKKNQELFLMIVYRLPNYDIMVYCG